MIKDMWADKYRPKTVSDYINQSDDLGELIKIWIAEGTFPHLLLSGHHGTGKTSLAYMLKNELKIDDFDFMTLNAAKDNSINIMRGKVTNFISGMPVGSDFKVVFLDEADRLSGEAMDFLKNTTEDYGSHVRFILTSNKAYKIPPEIQSRLKVIEFKGPDKVAMTERFIQILAAEKVKGLNLDIVQEYVDAFYPDFRKLLNTAQYNVRDGRLIKLTDVVSDTTEFMVKVVGFLDKDDWASAREYLSQYVPDDKWEECYKFLYTYLHSIGKFKDKKKWADGTVVLGKYLYQHAFVADYEINFAACLAELSRI